MYGSYLNRYKDSKDLSHCDEIDQIRSTEPLKLQGSCNQEGHHASSSALHAAAREEVSGISASCGCTEAARIGMQDTSTSGKARSVSTVLLWPGVVKSECSGCISCAHDDGMHDRLMRMCPGAVVWCACQCLLLPGSRHGCIPEYGFTSAFLPLDQRDVVRPPLEAL